MEPRRPGNSAATTHAVAFSPTRSALRTATSGARRPLRWAALIVLAGLTVAGTAAPGEATETDVSHATTAVLDWNAAMACYVLILKHEAR